MQILISPGYGAGLEDLDDLRTDLKLIKLVKEKKWNEAEAYIKSIDDEIDTEGLRDAVVEEITNGEYYTIEEYDGSESIIRQDAFYLAKENNE